MVETLVGGKELSSPKLAAALETDTEFTAEAWGSFGISGLTTEDFIQSGGKYFKPSVRGRRYAIRVMAGEL